MLRGVVRDGGKLGVEIIVPGVGKRRDSAVFDDGRGAGEVWLSNCGRRAAHDVEGEQKRRECEGRMQMPVKLELGSFLRSF